MRKRLRIAVVHSFYSRAQPSGENSVVLDQVNLLRDAGHTVTLVGRETDAMAGGATYALRSGVRVASGAGGSPARILRSFAPDLVHVHNTFPNWGTQWMRPWSDRLVATIHNYRPLCAASTLYRDGQACRECLSVPVLPAVVHKCYRDSALATLPIAIATSPRGALREPLRRAAAVIVLNQQARQTYESVLGRRCIVVPNFVEPLVNISHDQPQARRSRWVYIGRLSEEKGLLQLLRAWPEGQSLDIVGDGPLRSVVEERCSASKDLRYRGMLERAELLANLPHYSGLVVPSLWSEGLPTVILEAMAHGTPSLVSSEVGAAQELHDFGVAVVFDPRSGVTGVERGLRLLASQREVFRRTCRQVHSQRFSPEAWLQTMQRVYEDILG